MIPPEVHDAIQNALCGIQLERKRQIELFSKIIGIVDVDLMREIAMEYRAAYNRQTKLMHRMRRALAGRISSKECAEPEKESRAWWKFWG